MKKTLLFSLLIINGLAASAQIVDNAYKNNQPQENSPLSRIGLGNLTPQYFSQNAGFGGLTAAFRDRFSYNPFNPASLPALRTTAYEIGLYAKNNQVQTTVGSQSAWSGNLNYIALGFPTYSVINEVLDRKPRQWRWGMGLSLMPYNTVGYNVNTVTHPSNTDTADITNFFVGSGSAYRAMWGNGVSYKGLSVGANIGFVFGKMSYIRQNEFSSNLINAYSNYFEDSYTMSGLIWNLGVQYDLTLDPKKDIMDKAGRKHLVFGVYGNPATNFTTNSTRYYRRVGVIGTDSITGFTDLSGKGRLPSEFTAGVMYENGLTFRGGIEYKTAAWSNYFNDARSSTSDVLKDAAQFSVGAEFILDKNRLKSEEEKIRWKLGFRTGNDPRVLNGNQVSLWAASAGMCLPLRVGRGQQISYLNLGLEYGKLDAKTLSETYLRLTAGFTLNDNTWFLKRKFQ